MNDTVKTEVLPEVKPVSEKPRVERTGVVRKSKTAHAGRFSYKYASLADTIRVVNTEYGYDVQQTVQHIDQTDVVVTRYRESPEAEWTEWLAPVPVRAGAGGNNPMQAYGAALTYARRYSLQMALCMAADDTDGLEERKPQPVSEQMVQKINQLLQTMNVQNQQQAEHVYLAALAGHEINSSHDLTDIQAEQVIATLEKWRNQ